jgi:hypothetical protein
MLVVIGFDESKRTQNSIMLKSLKRSFQKRRGGGGSKKSVFISYRRVDIMTARAVYEHLSHHDYDCFLDSESIDSGAFQSYIVEQIGARDHFVLILTPTALDRCREPGDFLRLEIETALEQRRNIVPLLVDGFNFGAVPKESLTGRLELLPTYNG